MNNNQIRLIKFAKDKGLPYILNIPKINKLKDSICFLLVGSTATGLCDEHSDVDISLICKEDIFNEIAQGERWNSNRPSEILIENTQLHFYGVSLNNVIKKMVDLDDNSLYIYSNGIILKDNLGIYDRYIAPNRSFNEENRMKRLKTKLHTLIMRSSVLKSLLKNKLDRQVILGLYLEVIRECLKVIALLDNIEFDPRKRLYITALTGELGCTLIKDINVVYEDAGKADEHTKRADRINNLVGQIIAEAKKQGAYTT